MPSKRTVRGTKSKPVREVSKSVLAAHLKNIKAAVDRHRVEENFEHVHTLTPQTLAAKLRRVNSPFIYMEGWSGSNPGRSFEYVVYVYNPDPAVAEHVFAHVFVGSGNIVADIGHFLLNVDQRYGRFTEPSMPGLTLAPNGLARLRFTIKVPTTIDKTQYIGNTCLFQLKPLDRGVYLDRSGWIFAIT